MKSYPLYLLHRVKLMTSMNIFSIKQVLLTVDTLNSFYKDSDITILISLFLHMNSYSIIKQADLNRAFQDETVVWRYHRSISMTTNERVCQRNEEKKNSNFSQSLDSYSSRNIIKRISKFSQILQ